MLVLTACDDSGTVLGMLKGGAGQGYAAWRVLPAPEVWQQVVQEGLAVKQLAF